jgi:hypothetical membrane protein
MTSAETDSKRVHWIAPVAGLLATAWAVGVPLVFGALRDDYSHIQNYISELGERGAPYADWVNWAGFVPTGLLMLVFLAMARKRFPDAAWGPLVLFSAAGWGYILAAFFPCDPGCPEFGSLSQLIHSLSAVVLNIATALALIRLGRVLGRDADWQRWRAFTFVCGLLVAFIFVGILVPYIAPWRGLLQRISELAVWGWVAAISVKFASERTAG